MTNQTTMGELEFLRWVGSEEDATRYFETCRWPNGRFCPKCGSTNTYNHKSRRHYYRCRDCRSQFSCRMGTIMESSRIPMVEWLWVMYKIYVSRKGISSLQLAEVCYRLNEGNVKIHVRDRVRMLCAMCAGVTLPWKKLTED